MAHLILSRPITSSEGGFHLHSALSFLINPSLSPFSCLLISNVPFCLRSLSLTSCPSLPPVDVLRYIYGAAASFSGTGREFIESPGDDAGVFLAACLRPKGERPLPSARSPPCFRGKGQAVCAFAVSAEMLSWELSLIGIVRPPPHGPENENKAGNNFTAAAREDGEPAAAVRYALSGGCVHQEQQIH